MDTATIALRWQARSNILLGLLRLIAAFLFVQYGTSKLFAFPGPMMPGAETADPMSMTGAAGLLEVIGGGLLFLGLFTRPVAFILSGEMAFAYFIGHAPQGFWPVLNQGTPAILFCFLFLYFSAAGPGAFALSNLLHKEVRIGGFGHHEPLHHS